MSLLLRGQIFEGREGQTWLKQDTSPSHPFPLKSGKVKVPKASFGMNSCSFSVVPASTYPSFPQPFITSYRRRLLPQLNQLSTLKLLLPCEVGKRYGGRSVSSLASCSYFIAPPLIESLFQSQNLFLFRDSAGSILFLSYSPDHISSIRRDGAVFGERSVYHPFFKAQSEA